ncbi:hypothetical protein NL676_012347 [Syzygium grande]|nr:hypothetical protein NL676_012347 [Syzygium grande]
MAQRRSVGLGGLGQQPPPGIAGLTGLAGVAPRVVEFARWDGTCPILSQLTFDLLSNSRCIFLRSTPVVTHDQDRRRPLKPQESVSHPTKADCLYANMTGVRCKWNVQQPFNERPSCADCLNPRTNDQRPQQRRRLPPPIVSKRHYLLFTRSSELSFMAGKGKLAYYFIFFLCLYPSLEEQTWVKSGYFYAGSEIPVLDIDSSLFSHLICAFASTDPLTHPLFFNSSFKQIFSTFTGTVKRKNPLVTTMLSVWAGGEDSSAFASMLGESSSRRSTFIESTIEKARLFAFGGIDLFGIWPSRTINMTNLNALLGE